MCVGGREMVWLVNASLAELEDLIQGIPGSSGDFFFLFNTIYKSASLGQDV